MGESHPGALLLRQGGYLPVFHGKMAKRVMIARMRRLTPKAEQENHRGMAKQ
jgi:hypothetical protein